MKWNISRKTKYKILEVKKRQNEDRKCAIAKAGMGSLCALPRGGNDSLELQEGEPPSQERAGGNTAGTTYANDSVN